MKKPFSKKDFQKLEKFINNYDALHEEIRELEGKLQRLLKQQQSCVEELASTRKEEEAFFLEISERESIPVQDLKVMATAWVMEKK